MSVPYCWLRFALPLIMRCFSCTNRNLSSQWEILLQCKARILELVWSPHTNSGVKLSAIKFMQRLILVETRGVSDPRVPFISFSQNILLRGLTATYSFRTKMIPTFHLSPRTTRSSKHQYWRLKVTNSLKMSLQLCTPASESFTDSRTEQS